MGTASSGQTVSIHYTGTLSDGTVFDTSAQGDPLQFELGGGQIIPGLDDAIRGMAVGERKSGTVQPDEAYTCGLLSQAFEYQDSSPCARCQLCRIQATNSLIGVHWSSDLAFDFERALSSNDCARSPMISCGPLGWMATSSVSISFLRDIRLQRHRASRNPIDRFRPPRRSRIYAREVKRLSEGLNTVSFANRYSCKGGEYQTPCWNAVSIVDEGQIFAVARGVPREREIP